MRLIEWTVTARDDLAEIDSYWWTIDPDLAERLLSRIESAARILGDVPQVSPAVTADVRKWTVRGTPYLLLYRVAERVEIVRVLHASRDWSAKL